ncbi:MAG: asparagine synthase (glutamine-hydrolyzing) [Nitrospirae bacterium]|nr:asparagine synthase (glutamine-hydrolyzing) [Nitrospirota bacterium]
MCGIAGIFKVNGRVTVDDVSAVLKMMDTQVHRGPNDWGLLLPDESLHDPQIRGLLAAFDKTHIRTYRGSVDAPSAVLGARRLSIIDLSPRGRMPMGSADGRVWLTYNGEIYNYRELRAELMHRGYAFQSDTDTEVILHGYEEWGADVVQHLQGMFAVAFFDIRAVDKPELFLAKDRFGMKPLYWARKNGTFQFASEVRALMAGGLIPNEPEPRGFHGFLVFGSVPTPFTTVRDVFSLPAAHSLLINERRYSFPTPSRYWSIPKSGVLSVDFGEAVAETRRLLAESVESHLVSDVPLGVFLSGGLDSSAITAFAAKKMASPLTTLCVSFEEQGFSEGHHAEQVSREFGCKHIDVRLRARDFVEEIPKILAAMDQPTVDGVNTYFIAKAAREAGLTVVLSGLGGDELFWGYPGFRSGPRLFNWAKLPGLRLAAAGVGALSARLGLDRWEKAEFLREDGPIGAYCAIRGLFPPHRAARLLGAGLLPLIAPDMRGRSLSMPEYAQLEFDLYLQNQLLRDTDVFGMAHSLEIRVPFLDHRLVEFVSALPEAIKTSKVYSKYLLIASLGKDLNASVYTRSKMGFTFPFEQWMKEYSADIARHAQCSFPIEKSQARAVESAFNRGQMHWSRPWAVAVLKGLSRISALPVWRNQAGLNRILLLLPEVYRSKGGIPVFGQDLTRALGEGFPQSELRVISVNDDLLPSNHPDYSRVNFIGCGPKGSVFRKWRFAYNVLCEVLMRRPNILVCGHINFSPLVALVSFVSNIRVVLVTYGIEAWNPNVLLRMASKWIQYVVSISQYTATRMEEWGVKRDRMSIVFVAVDGEIFRPIRRGKLPDSPVLLTVARLDASERYKGVDRVLNVLGKVRARSPGVRYIIAGKGNDLPRLEALAHEYGVADCVEFRGYVSDEDLPELFSVADIFVMPSQKEGFGIVFIEALACGVPVIAGNCDGSVEAVLNGRIGLLVDPDKPADLEQGILSFLDRTITPRLLDKEYLRRECLDSYGFDRFRENVRTSFERLS